jgi:dihydroxyacetone kinase
MELAIVARGTLANLRQQGINVERAFSGNFMTSLEMPGCSISLLRLNQQLLSALDYPVQTAAWVNVGKIAAQRLIYQAPISLTPENIPNDLPLNPNLKQIGLKIASALEQAETRLTELDSAAGDGDLGLSMCRGVMKLTCLVQLVKRYVKPLRVVLDHFMQLDSFVPRAI